MNFTIVGFYGSIAVKESQEKSCMQDKKSGGEKVCYQLIWMM